MLHGINVRVNLEMLHSCIVFFAPFRLKQLTGWLVDWVALSHIRKPISDWFVGGICLTPLYATLNRIPAQGFQSRPWRGTSNILKERERALAFRLECFPEQAPKSKSKHSQLKNKIATKYYHITSSLSTSQTTRSRNVNHNRWQTSRTNWFRPNE
jgi:hypothetical protein